MDIEKIRNFFQADKYLVMTGVHLERVDEDFAVCTLNIGDQHMNAGGVVQGGAIYTLADSAFAIASNATTVDRGERRITVNQSASISYFRPPKGKKLTVTAKKLSGGNRTAVYSMEVTDELGTKVALMIGNGYTIER